MCKAIEIMFDNPSLLDKNIVLSSLDAFIRVIEKASKQILSYKLRLIQTILHH